MEPDKPREPGLARAEDTNRLQADLDRVLTDSLMAHTDRGGALARDLETSAGQMLPSLADIDSRFAKKEEQPAQSNMEIGEILSGGWMNEIAVEDMRLADLLGSGGTSLQEMAIIKRGILFLRKRMYTEAADWWRLNRPKDAIAEARFYCICALLLAFTYQLAGRTREAEAAAQEALRVKNMI